MNKKYVIPLVVVLLLITVGPLLGGQDPYEQNLMHALQGPSSAHWLGTDQYGRDVLARVLLGGRLTIGTTVCIVGVATVVGAIAGILGGYKGGLWDWLVIRMGNLFLSLPTLVLAIALAAVLGGGLDKVAYIFIFLYIPKYARLARSLTKSLQSAPFIHIAKLEGHGTFHIAWHYIGPMIGHALITTAALDMGVVLMELAGLSFLGLGAMPPTPEWGSMLSAGRSVMQTAPWLVLGPGLGLVLTVGAIQLASEEWRRQV
ncbi:ABC transporter permease [uncultured Veillonella sp.]|uniref:ABC transporter permease n=1 Tax=uncultured Veillonella sp. TaxID=159268 RepID=UPI002608CA62|nr:ABC transporter permease [uncultured Veillonella sp.]